MKISSIKTTAYKQNFSAEYKTEDVLRLITSYPYKNKGSRDIIKGLTSVDIYSKEFTSSLPPDYLYGVSTAAYEILCKEKVLEQKKEFEEADMTFDATLHLREGKKQTEEWFKSQIKKLGSVTDIDSFTISREEFENKYKSFIDLLDKIGL